MKLAPWAKAEESHKMWASWRAEFFSKVRFTFVLLLAISFYVIISNNQLRIEMAASKDIHRVFKPVSLSDKLQRKAMVYQATVDTVSDFQQATDSVSH
jgi:hypothetical protein